MKTSDPEVAAEAYSPYVLLAVGVKTLLEVRYTETANRPSLEAVNLFPENDPAGHEYACVKEASTYVSAGSVPAPIVSVAFAEAKYTADG
jgi:hypothetical protein